MRVICFTSSNEIEVPVVAPFINSSRMKLWMVGVEEDAWFVMYRRFGWSVEVGGCQLCRFCLEGCISVVPFCQFKLN